MPASSSFVWKSTRGEGLKAKCGWTPGPKDRMNSKDPAKQGLLESLSFWTSAGRTKKAPNAYVACSGLLRREKKQTVGKAAAPHLHAGLRLSRQRAHRARAACPRSDNIRERSANVYNTRVPNFMVQMLLRVLEIFSLFWLRATTINERFEVWELMWALTLLSSCLWGLTCAHPGFLYEM